MAQSAGEWSPQAAAASSRHRHRACCACRHHRRRRDKAGNGEGVVGEAEEGLPPTVGGVEAKAGDEASPVLADQGLQTKARRGREDGSGRRSWRISTSTSSGKLDTGNGSSPTSW
ncbi:hypothetical protein E2562_019889 [Oryza meyeriana var. granulata]|uniref:Uncharacterized protein n=1 Tax=Oryza meyeriana var. granulata TaxID=110450 RepID=A0A6G1EXE1_9ORYZ|nr:hypothetical protein E2562_019889 [Oryza meyeriana var. granulata]